MSISVRHDFIYGRYFYYIYLIVMIIGWIMSNNELFWEEINKEFTGYFDIDGNPIYTDSVVSYKGKEYLIEGKCLGSKDDRLWLRDPRLRGVVMERALLDDAAADCNGKLRVVRRYI